jgi:fucose permease
MSSSGDRVRLSVAVSYGAFVLVGISAGVGGVLLPAQMSDYGVDRTKIGITFFLFSAGFMLAGSSTGTLMHRYGIRLALTVGTVGVALTSFYLAVRPSFVALVAVQLLAGYGIGMLESVLNAYLAQLPGAVQRVNRLHAFFGVGALAGPPLATWMLRSWSWTAVYLVIGLLDLALMPAILLLFPKRDAPQPNPTPDTVPASASHPPLRGLLAATVRERAVLLGALFLAVYVGLEIGFGNWGFSFLVDGRGLSPLLAGSVLGGYWLGLTAGRFVISPVALKAGITDVGMAFICLAGVLASAGLIWATSAAALTGAGCVLLGFFLGPLFPTTMAITPRLAPQPLVSSAIGFINGVSVIGGSALPWLAGAIAQSAGITTLLPFCFGLGVLLVLIWWRLARHVPALAPDPSPALGYSNPSGS